MSINFNINMAKIESPYQKAKKTFTRQYSGAEGLKLELRKRFRDRIRDIRSKSFDGYRNLKDEVNAGFHDLVLSFEGQAHKFDFVQPDDILKTLKDIQNELLEQIANAEVIAYESFLQDEVNSMVENLITCKICEQFSEKDICDDCSAKHFAD